MDGRTHHFHQRKPLPPSAPICINDDGRRLSTLRSLECYGPLSPYAYPLPPQSRPPLDMEEDHFLLPHNPHARYLLEPVEHRGVQRLFEQRYLPPRYSNSPNTRFHDGSLNNVFFDSSHNPSNARFSNRVIYPDERPDGHGSVCDIGGEDGLFVRDRNLMRDFPLGSHTVFDEYRANEIVGCKRRRLEELEKDDDYFPAEGYNDRSLKKVGFSSDCRAGVHRQDPPFKWKSSGKSSNNVMKSGFLHERPERDEVLVSRGRHHHHLPYSINHSLSPKVRYSSSGMFNSGSSSNFRENRFAKNILSSKDWNNAEDTSTRKPSVLSRIEYAKPLWNRVDEKGHAPRSSPIYESGCNDNSAYNEVHFKTNTLMPIKAISAQNMQDDDETDGKQRIPKKELPRSNLNRKKFLGVPSVISNKNITKNSKERNALLQKSKKARTPISQRCTPVKRNRNPMGLEILKEDADGIGITVSNGEGITAMKERDGTYNACVLTSGLPVSSHFTSKDAIANEARFICLDKNTKSDGNVTAIGTSKNRETNKTGVSVSPSSCGNCKIAKISNENIVKRVTVSSALEKVSYGDRTSICPAEEIVDATNNDVILHSDSDLSVSGRAMEKKNKSVVFYQKGSVLETGDGLKNLVSTANLRDSEGETTHKMQEEIPDSDLAHCKTKIATDGTLKEKKQTVIIPGEVLGGVSNKIERLYMDFTLDSIDKVCKFGNGEVVKNSVFRPSCCTKPNEDPARSLTTKRKRKRKKKSKAGNLLAKLGVADEKCKLEGPYIQSKDASLLEESHMRPQGKSIKKKCKLYNPSESPFTSSSLPTLQNASKSREGPHSCNNQNQLDAICDDISLENHQKYPLPLSPNNGISSIETDKTVLASVSSIHPNISILNSPGKIEEVVLAKSVTLSPEVKGDGCCRSLEYPRKKNYTLKLESSGDYSKSRCAVQMPLLGDDREFISPIETIDVFSTGGLSNGDVTEERGEIKVKTLKTLLEADSMTYMVQGCISEITETGCTTDFDFLEQSVKNIKQEERQREQDKAYLNLETRVSGVAGSSSAIGKEYHCQPLQLIDTIPQYNNVKIGKGESSVLSESDATCDSPRLKLELDIHEKIILNNTQSGEIIGGRKSSKINDPIKISLPNPIKLPDLGPLKGVELDKLAAGYQLLHCKKLFHLSEKEKKHTDSSSKVEVIESSNLIKNSQKLQFPQRNKFSLKPPGKVTPLLNVRHKIWRRAEICPSSTPQQPPLKLSSLNSSQLSSTNKFGKQYGSYVRKGNSLIRKSGTVTTSAQSSYFDTSSRPPRTDSSNNIKNKSGDSNVSCSKVEEYGVKDEGVLSESKKLDLGSSECYVESKKITSNQMTYVRHKSNQLVAASGLGIIKSSSQVSKRARALTSAFSDGAFIRKKKALAAREKKFKEPRFSLVWKLGVKSKNQEFHSISNIFPSIFPWKRVTCWKSLIHRTLTKRPSTLISNLQSFRKRNTVYAVSKGGYSIRKAGVLSIGSSNLKWSKSIEKRSKQANEEATLAVAEANRKRREQKGLCHLRMGSKKRDRVSKACVFRVGTIRYKMDSSRMTLIRLPDLKSSSLTNLQPEQENQTFCPRRLLIGNDEYVRVGNGNKLVRDPKKLVRILASEKIRWSLHTARLRLARKRQYCQFFTRFGKCNEEGGKCPYIHDPTKVAICTKFIKGLCSGGDCRLTHQVIPERMPDCSYFLQGLCTNISCPYRHVKVNSKTSICEGFLKGYCSNGDECRKKHSYVCPNFEATGKCLDGSACKLHHPKSINKFKARKKNEATVRKRNRYFISDIDQLSECDLKGKTNEKEGEDISLCDPLSEYISLDSTEDLQPFDQHLFDNWSDVDALIKPRLIMTGK